MKPIQVGLLGIGTVGSGVFNVLKRNQAEILRALDGKQLNGLVRQGWPAESVRWCS